MASAYKGDDKIAITYIGDGSTAEGDFHGPDLRQRLPRAGHPQRRQQPVGHLSPSRASPGQ
jgi:hypothetical protein